MNPELRFRALGLAGSTLVRGIFATTRTRRVGAEHYLAFRRRGHPVIFAFWHGHLLPLLYHHRHEDAVVLVSEHADGEYVAQVLERLGFRTARGSSTRGGSRGLRALVRAAREGHDLAITPDGPRGPARTFKPGALVAAALTGLPIIPVAAAARPAWRLRSWDGFLVPRPLARIRLIYGEPWWIERDAGPEALDRHARGLEAALARLSAAAEAEVGAPAVGASDAVSA